MSIEKSFNELVAVLPDKTNLNKAETHSFKYACINLIKDELTRKNKLNFIEKISSSTWFKTTDIMKYDIISYSFSGAPHPAIVYKVLSDTVLVIPFSTTKSTNNFDRIDCRLLADTCYISKTIFEVDKKIAIDMFIGVYPNKAQINKVFREIKEHYRTMFNFKK